MICDTTAIVPYRVASWILYIHKNKKNGKMYIGITSKRNPEKRWRDGNGYACSKKFEYAIQKYGWDGFEHLVLYNGLSHSEALILESIYILALDTMNSGYNSHAGMRRSIAGKVMSAEYRKAHSGINNGRHSKIICLNTGVVYPTIKDASEKTGIKQTSISGSCQNHGRKATMVKTGNPIVWMYYEEAMGLTKQQIEKLLSKKRRMTNSISVICLNTGQVYESIRTACKILNISNPSGITKCCTGRRKSCGIDAITGEKLRWKYA